MRIGQIAIDVAPLRESRDFRRMFAGQFLSMAGAAVATTAANWQVYNLTHNSLAVGLLTLGAGDRHVHRPAGRRHARRPA